MTPFTRLLLATAAALIAAPVFAGEPAPTPEDPQLNRLTYSALQKDEDLADRNIGVRVLRGGAAVLWGTATKAESAKAEALLKRLPGITSVKNTCDAAGASDPLVARVEAAVKEPTPPVDATKSDRPIVEAVKAEPPKPTGPAPLPTGAAVSRHSTTVEKPSLTSSDAREPATRLLEPVASPAVDYAAVERIRRSDARFSRLTFDLRDGRIVIGSSAADSAVAWEMARKVAPLVGDRDVVVGRLKGQ